MTPGPTLIKKCTACAKFIEEETIASGNTFGARCWTDGKIIAPMLPDQLWLVMCPHCRSPLWLDELEVLAELPIGAGGKFRGQRPYVEPSFVDYLALIAKGDPEPEKTRYLRIRAWWEGNERRRGGDPEQVMTAHEVTNLEALVADLGDDGENGLMKAEALRELGRFDEARSLLASVKDPDLQAAAERIESLCDHGDPVVRELVSR